MGEQTQDSSCLSNRPMEFSQEVCRTRRRQEPSSERLRSRSTTVRRNAQERGKNPTNLGVEPDPGTEGRRPRGDAMARRGPARRGAPPPPAGDPGNPRPGDIRNRELGGPVGRADVEHQAKRSAPLGAGGEDGTGPRKAGASRGGSYQLSATKGSARGGVADEANVLPASAPMASTDRRKLEIRTDRIVAVGSCKNRGFLREQQWNLRKQGVKTKAAAAAGAPLRLCAHLFLLKQPDGAQGCAENRKQKMWWRFCKRKRGENGAMR